MIWESSLPKAQELHRGPHPCHHTRHKQAAPSHSGLLCRRTNSTLHSSWAWRKAGEQMPSQKTGCRSIYKSAGTIAAAHSTAGVAWWQCKHLGSQQSASSVGGHIPAKSCLAAGIMGGKLGSGQLSPTPPGTLAQGNMPQDCPIFWPACFHRFVPSWRTGAGGSARRAGSAWHSLCSQCHL